MAGLDELHQARRKDNRKVMITDAAIEKVPLVRYPGIPEEQYGILQQIAKQVLIISRDRNDGNEVAITYSLDSRRLISEGKEYYGVALGDGNSVDPSDDTVAYHLLNSGERNVIVTIHNHPSLSLLSLADALFLLEYASVRMIVAVTNLGGIFYLAKTDRYDRNAAILLLKEAATMKPDDASLKARQ